MKGLVIAMKKKNEFNYFDEFAKSVSLAIEATKELKKYIFNFSNSNSDLEMKKIHQIKNNADRNLRQLKNFLLKDFLPPIDRKDILAISYRIDALVDGIDEIAIDINIFSVTLVKKNMKVLIELLEKSVRNSVLFSIGIQKFKESTKNKR